MNKKKKKILKTVDLNLKPEAPKVNTLTTRPQNRLIREVSKI
jgi:hypothetical protein